MEYFEIFDLPPKLNLDLNLLQQRFHELSREHHPDYHRTLPAAEQERALRTTALLNDAYRTLRDSSSRVEYLIESNGFVIDGSKVPKALLAEVFEINEELEQVRLTRKNASADESVLQNLEQFRKMIARRRQAYEEELSGATHKWDELVDSLASDEARREHLSALADIVAQSAYLRNLEREIENEVAG